jgi:TM2 domain-containing membrane protein YozV
MSDLRTANTTDDRLRQNYETLKKSVGIAYLLWFFFGGLGGHRFYMGRTPSAVILLISAITIHALGLYVTPFFYLLALVPFTWVMVDAFLIPSLVRQHNEDLVSPAS